MIEGAVPSIQLASVAIAMLPLSATAVTTVPPTSITPGVTSISLSAVEPAFNVKPLR